MLIQIFGICLCHVCRGRGENPCAKTARNHSFKHKASARQRNPSREGLRKKTARHAEVDCCNPKEGSIRVRIQAQQVRKVEIQGKEVGKENCQLSQEGERKLKNGDTTVELHLSLSRLH